MNKRLLLLLLTILFSHSFSAQTKPSSSENFNSFLKKFNEDSNFQVSRINFPLTVKVNNDNLELVDYVFTKEKYVTIKLINGKESTFKQKPVLKNSTVVVQQRGIDNGIFTDFIFVQRKGLWYLKTWVDSST